ncbi:MAG: DNA polymerase I [Parcubacteria group bacterium Gr01-1014_8]|nr:MAG: DNA polymerase I [Parcubacteria group bacterium Gr01-1014_8]
MLSCRYAHYFYMAKGLKKDKKLKRLVLLDSHAVLHRAYHAIPDFATSKGEPTGALYGLVSMLLKMIADLQPDYVVAARDLPGGTHRHQLFEEYKATRAKADDELIAQLERAPRVFEAFGIPVCEAPGYEADDVLATIVKQLSKKEDVEIIIVTGDMDTLQLIDDERVRVYTLKQGISDTILYDEDRVKERYGFGPEMIPDYKGLRGDPSDNIKGIAGIGEKTATELIEKFGSIDDIYKALKKTPKEFEERGVKPRIVQLLISGEKDARFSKELATVKYDAPVNFHIPREVWSLKEHAQSIVALCEEFEFRSLGERVKALTEQKAAIEQEKIPVATVLPADLREVAIALWLIRSDVTDPSLEDILQFAKTDDFETAREIIFKTLRKTGSLGEVFDGIEKPLIPLVDRMNRTGVELDTKYLKELSREYTKELGIIAGRIYSHAGREFNISSPKQLGVILFDELKLALPRQKKTATGARTTKEEELAKMSDQHPIIADVLAFRELQKLLSTYIESMTEFVGDDGRLHAEFLQAGTTTGRMSSKNPNMQNVPIRTEYGKRIRRAFIAKKGFVLCSLDYSQIELRIAAGLSGDEKLIGVFKEGKDIHAAVAAQVFAVPPELVDYEMRRRAKVINFGIIYGMGVNALRQALGDNVTREEAAKFLSDYFANFPGLARYIERTKQSAASLGYTETLYGRRRYFSGFKSTLPSLRAQAERMAINAPIQGTQSDIIKLAMVEADQLIEKRDWRNKAALVLQVHDELVYELKEEEAEMIAREIKNIMESSHAEEKLGGVPIIAEASIGKNWGSLEKLPQEG